MIDWPGVAIVILTAAGLAFRFGRRVGRAEMKTEAELCSLQRRNAEAALALTKELVEGLNEHFKNEKTATLTG